MICQYAVMCTNNGEHEIKMPWGVILVCTRCKNLYEGWDPNS